MTKKQIDDALRLDHALMCERVRSLTTQVEYLTALLTEAVSGPARLVHGAASVTAPGFGVLGPAAVAAGTEADEVTPEPAEPVRNEIQWLGGGSKPAAPAPTPEPIEEA